MQDLMEKPPSLAGSLAPWLPAPAHSQPSFLPFLYNPTPGPGQAGPHCTYREKQQYDRLETVCRLEKLIITSVCLRNLISPALTHSLFSHPSPFTPRSTQDLLGRRPPLSGPPTPTLQWRGQGMKGRKPPRTAITGPLESNNK